MKWYWETFACRKNPLSLTEFLNEMLLGKNREHPLLTGNKDSEGNGIGKNSRASSAYRKLMFEGICEMVLGKIREHPLLIGSEDFEGNGTGKNRNSEESSAYWKLSC